MCRSNVKVGRLVIVKRVCKHKKWFCVLQVVMICAERVVTPTCKQQKCFFVLIHDIIGANLLHVVIFPPCELRDLFTFVCYFCLHRVRLGSVRKTPAVSTVTASNNKSAFSCLFMISLAQTFFILSSSHPVSCAICLLLYVTNAYTGCGWVPFVKTRSVHRYRSGFRWRPQTSCRYRSLFSIPYGLSLHENNGSYSL
jgi:hypothetical protein